MDAKFLARIAESIRTAPPLSPEQVDRLTVLLHPADQDTAAA